MNSQDEPSLNNFCEIARTGEAYFAAHTAIADAILAGMLPQDSVVYTHLPAMTDLVDRILPLFFKTLTEIADKRGIDYQCTLSHEDYKSIYKVYVNPPK